MNVTERRERFRTVLAGDQCVYPAPVYDPITAQIAEDLGYEIGFMIAAAAQWTVLGAANRLVWVITLNEFADLARHICRSSSISVMVGAHHGFGNAFNVMRTVEELESAGVSALTIDDFVGPIGFGSTARMGSGERELISLEEGVGKMKAALAARQDPSLVIAGFTSALRNGGIPEVIRRVKAYEEVGVDAIFVPFITRREEIEAIHAETRLPLLLGGDPELAGDRFLAANGVRMKSHGPLSFYASVKAAYDTLKGLRDGKSIADLQPTLASPELLAQVLRQSQYNEWINSFLS